MRATATARAALRIFVLAAAIASLVPAAARATGTLVVTHSGDSGPGSLRQAIDDANADPAANTIAFNIPASDPGFNGQWFTIRPLSELPPLTDDATTIDGSTQAAFTGDTNPLGPEIELEGSAAPPTGLRISSSDSRVAGLAMNRFGGAVILVNGSRNTVAGNYLGTDPTGTAMLGNGHGILVGEASPALLGRSNRIIGNVIADNAGPGIQIAGGDQNVVQGNRTERNQVGIGLGAGLTGTPAEDNLIGGALSGAGNLISGNATGIRLSETARTVILRNDIRENRSSGVFVGWLSPASGIVGNLIADNGGAGVEIGGADDTTIRGNRIERNGWDTTLLGCAFGCGGIVVGGFNPSGARADRSIIGGPGPGEGNVISGGGNAGIEMRELSGDGTTIQGNLIGTDTSGTADFGNRFLGILVGGTNTVVGGADPGARNVISGNDGGGVGVGGPDAVIQRNYVGTTADGTAALPNGLDGMSIGGSGALVIGNVISANDGIGVSVRNTASGVVVRNNLIGTDVTGANDLGNGRHGVQSGLGGPRIAGNRVVVQGNRIAFNGGDGARMIGDATPLVVGGAAPGAGNVISGNGGFGVLLTGQGGSRVEANTITENARAGIAVASGTANTLTRNNIFGNGELGIELRPFGVTPNDEGDADTGANGLQNFPVLRQAVMAPGRTVVVGWIDTPNPETVTIELFANTAADPSGHGEGETFLGTATPNRQGHFTAVLPPVAAGRFVTATATDAAGNTSEFALNVTARGTGPP